jgi:molecular chaperone GrpE (heat shock protein)
MTTADKAKQRVAESLLSKIDACDRLLDKIKQLDSYEKVFKTRLLLLTRLEDLVLCT